MRSLTKLLPRCVTERRLIWLLGCNSLFIISQAPVSPRREVAAVKSPKSNDEAKKKSVAIAARPVVPSAQINAALPQSLGGLRVVK